MVTAEDILSQIRTRRTRVTREIITQRLLGLADRYLPRFRNVFLSAVRMGRRVSLEKIAEAVATRNVAAVEAVIPWESAALPALEVTVPAMVRELTLAGARVATRLLPGNLNVRLDDVSRAVEIPYRFNLQNPLAVKAALDHAAELVVQISDETVQALRNIIARAIEEGIPPMQAARQIRRTVGLTERQEGAIAKLREAGASERELTRARERMLRERAQLIAQTETLRAANEGQRLLWEQMAESRLIEHSTARREFIVTPDDRLCPICLPLDGKTYGIEEPIVTELGSVDAPPIHPRCLPGDALVTPGNRIAGQSERRYEGPLVVVSTASGKRLACTPNHPVLTDSGWIAAGALYEVGHVLSRAQGDRVLLGDDDRHYVPASIEEIARSCGKSGEMTAREVPVAPEDFHGDGKGSEVAVVRTHCLLGHGLEATEREQVIEQMLIRLHAAYALSTLRMGNLLGYGPNTAPRSLMRCAYLALALRLIHEAPLQKLGLVSASWSDTLSNQAQADDVSADAELVRKLLLGRSSEVTRDKIVSIEYQSFHGMVYNLDCGGWYIANGIITSNCRCTMALTIS